MTIKSEKKTLTILRATRFSLTAPIIPQRAVMMMMIPTTIAKIDGEVSASLIDV